MQTLIIDEEILRGCTQQPPLAYKLGIIGFLAWMQKYDAQHGERQFPLKEECIPFIHTHLCLSNWNGQLFCKIQRGPNCFWQQHWSHVGIMVAKSARIWPCAKPKQFLLQWRSSFHFSVKETLAKSRQLWSPISNFMVKVLANDELAKRERSWS